MATKFNTVGTNSKDASEATLKAVLSQLQSGVEVSAVVPLDTNTNVTRLGGNLIATGAGITTNGTIRVVQANDQPGGGGTSNVNIVQLGGNPIDTNPDPGVFPVSLESINTTISVALNNYGLVPTGNGTAETLGQNALRVAIANDQDTSAWGTINTNVLNLDLDQGVAGSSTLRVVNANDQSHLNSAPKPVTIKKASNVNYLHYTCYATNKAAATNNNANFIQENDRVFYDTTTGIYGDWLLPSVQSTMYIVSDSALDTAGGIGARSVNITFFTDFAGTELTQSVPLTGTTPALIATTIVRIKSIRVTQTGSSNFNQGTIIIQDSLVPTSYYPGSIEPNSNKWNSGAIFIPAVTATSEADSKVFQQTYIDYSNFIIDNNGGSDETIFIFVRPILGPTVLPFTLQQKIITNNNMQCSLDNSSSKLLGTAGYDIILAYQKPAGAGTFNMTVALGCHSE